MDKKIEAIIQTVDLEGVNNSTINQIGFFACDQNGVPLVKREWSIKLKDGTKFDLHKSEFWDKYPKLLKYIEATSLPENIQIKDFVNTFDGVSKYFNFPEEKITIVSNNPEYDFGQLSTYIKEHCRRDPLRYTTTGKYRSIKDIGEALRPLGIHNIVKKNASEIQTHDHSAPNDAEHICMVHLIGVEVINAIKKELGGEIERIAQRVAKEKADKIKKARQEAKV
jgi:hypothetical protein